MPKTPTFIVAVALLALATGASLFQASRGLDWSGESARRPQRAGRSVASADDARPPMPITIDGVSLRTEALPAPDVPRLVARTVTCSLSTDRFHDILDAIDRLVLAHHGARVGVVATTTGSSGAAPGRRSLTATLTVPVAEADATLAAARALGTVLQESASTEDLTGADRALRSRIESARSEDRRLTGLLAAGTAGIPDVSGVQRAQARARVEAERLTAEDAALEARTSVLTIILKIEMR